MSTMTQAQADRIHERTMQIVADMRRRAESAACSGQWLIAADLNRLADSRERAGAHAHAGARIGRA
jgi:hypothetical protein